MKQDDAMKLLAFSIKLLLNAVIVLSCTVSCGNGSTAQLLDDVKSYIRERPDSALRVEDSQYQVPLLLMEVNPNSDLGLPTDDFGYFTPSISLYPKN